MNCSVPTEKKRYRFTNWLCFALCLFCLAPAAAQNKINTETTTRPDRQWLPSAKPSGEERNDRIWFTYYPAIHKTAARTPAAVLLHHLGGSGSEQLHQFARHLNQNGIAALVMVLPYHGPRSLPGTRPLDRFVAPEAAPGKTPPVAPVVQAFEQSTSDVSTVVTWLQNQPEIDPTRIGAVGVSLGAIVLHLTMGLDERIRAGVAFLGAGNLVDINQDSLLGRLFLRSRRWKLTTQDIEQLKTVDPLTYANRNRPRRVLMVQAARDAFIPQHAAQELWEALGRPPIQWLDTNHMALSYAQRSAMRAATAYLQMAWQQAAGESTSSAKIPTIKAPTIKVGVITGLDTLVTPAIQLQALRLGTRKHMSLLSGNVGLTSRGPFVSVAATINAFVDVGVGRRVRGDAFRPYVSWHVVF
jgi:dienelactone hydrolase